MTHPFSYGRIVLLGFGFLSITMAWSLFNSYVPIFLRQFLPSAAVIGMVMSLDNIAGMTLQPWFGALSDRTKSRLGRRLPYLVVGMPLAAVAFALLPLATSLLLLILAIVAVDLSMSLFRAPTIALMPDVTPPEERSRANGIINFMGGVGALLALFGGAWLYRLDPSYPFFATGVVFIVVLLLLVTKLKDAAHAAQTLPGELPDEAPTGILQAARDLPRSNQPLLWTLFGLFGWSLGQSGVEAFLTTYAVTVLGWHESQGAFMFGFFALAYIASAIPAGWVGQRLGSRQVLTAGLCALTILVACVPFFRSPVAIGGLMVMGGIAWGFVTVNAYPLVVQMGDPRAVGTSTGLYYFATSLAASAGPPLAGSVMDLIGHSWLFGFSSLSFGLALLCMIRSNRLSAAAAVQHGAANAPR